MYTHIVSLNQINNNITKLYYNFKDNITLNPLNKTIYDNEVCRIPVSSPRQIFCSGNNFNEVDQFIDESNNLFEI